MFTGTQIDIKPLKSNCWTDKIIVLKDFQRMDSLMAGGRKNAFGFPELLADISIDY